MTNSREPQQHGAGEQVLNWSGLPVVQVRSTIFLEHPFFLMLARKTILEDGTMNYLIKVLSCA